MTTKRDSKSKPKKDERSRPRVKDLESREEHAKGVRGGKVNPQDLSFTKYNS